MTPYWSKSSRSTLRATDRLRVCIVLHGCRLPTFYYSAYKIGSSAFPAPNADVGSTHTQSRLVSSEYLPYQVWLDMARLEGGKGLPPEVIPFCILFASIGIASGTIVLLPNVPRGSTQLYRICCRYLRFSQLLRDSLVRCAITGGRPSSYLKVHPRIGLWLYRSR